MTTTTTADALLDAVLANPGDDAPRLIWADWLEERDGPGDAERALFVRCQVELAQPHDKIRPSAVLRFTGLLRRERELLLSHGHDWLRGIGIKTLSHDGGESEGANYEIVTGTEKGSGVQVEFRRGFVEEVVCRLEKWTGGVGAALVACQPVTTVRVTDREPYRSPGAGWSWYRGETPSGEHPPSDLPLGLFGLLDGGDLLEYFRWYDTEAAALADLSSACLLLAKGGDA